MNAKSDFIISYDISDSKRLQRLARRLEKVAMRIQYSVFFCASVTQTDLFAIIEDINEVINQDEDDVRIYHILDAGIALGQAVDLDEPFISPQKG